MAYRRTLFDRLGPEAADFYNALRGGVITGALGAVGGSMYAAQHGTNRLVGGLVAGLGAAVVSWLAIIGISRLAGGVLGTFIQSGGTYEQKFSYEDSLLARGHYAEAIASFERHAAEGTGGATVMLRAADLRAKHGGNPKRASELYRDVQRLPGVSTADHVYATNRLIDLYMGPLPNADAAVSELRRLIATYPSSDAAKHARIALVNLKRQMRAKSPD